MEFPVKCPDGLPIQNVVRSSDDKLLKGYGSWLNLWQRVTGSTCNVNCVRCGKAAEVGGHVVVGNNTARQQPKGSNRVFILPLCNTCNHDNKVMYLKKPEKAVYLIKYLCDVLPYDSPYSNYSNNELNQLYDDFYKSYADAIKDACLNEEDMAMIDDGHGVVLNRFDINLYLQMLSQETKLSTSNNKAHPSQRSGRARETIMTRKSTRAHKAWRCDICGGNLY